MRLRAGHEDISQHPAHPGAEGLRETHVPRNASAEKARAAAGTVHQGVAYHKVTGHIAVRKGPHGARGHDLLHAQGFQRPDVGVGGNFGGQVAMAPPVTREKSNGLTPDIGQGE